jgi:CRP/FNR family transcriptional regulator
MPTMSAAKFESHNLAHLGGKFFDKLTPAAMQDLISLEIPSSHEAGEVLFAEKEASHGVYIVLEGEVTQSINSSDGRRLNLSIARKGDILGLAAALMDKEYDTTAETFYPSKVAHISSRDFNHFLARHPEVFVSVAQELSRHVTMAREQLRTVGLAAKAPEKLARLLLEFSESGQVTEVGTRFRFTLTHEQIGEFIGTSRETVTRTMAALKNRRLVAFHGCMAVIPSKTALAQYAHA